MLRTGDRFLLFPAICHTIYKEIYVISKDYTLGIDIGSTTVKIAILDPGLNLMFADYCRHHADIRGTLRLLVVKARALLWKRSRPRPMSPSNWAVKTPRSSILKTVMSSSA